MNRRDEPNCDHVQAVVLVTNQPEHYDSFRSHRAVWVCGRRSCVLDALAWVERGTGERAHWRVGPTTNGNAWRFDTPAESEVL